MLQMKHFLMGEWLQPQKSGKNVEKIGVPLSDPWEWSLGYRMPCTRRNIGASQALQLAYDRAAMVKEKEYQLTQSMGHIWTLARRSLGPYEGNPIKAQGEKDLVPRLEQTMEGQRKEDTPTKDEFPVGIDISEVLAYLGMAKDATEVVKAAGDYALIAFYNFLRVGKYTVKVQRNDTKKIVHFKLEDEIFLSGC